MHFFDGKTHAQNLDSKISDFISLNPLEVALLIIQIGENAESTKYINLKKKFCEKLNIPVRVELLYADDSDDILYQQIKDLVNETIVGGCIIQLPLPRQSLQKVLNLIPFNKDVDLLSNTSLTQFYSGDFTKLSPVVRSIRYFMEDNDIQSQNMTTIVIGAGELVGRPVTHFLSQQGSKVQILDKKENYDNLYSPGRKLNCDLLILSAGIPKLVKGDDISENCSVIDFGSSIVDGKTVGDLDLDSRLDHLNIISPSPGGMGPLVVRFLIINFLEFVTGKQVL